MSFDLHAANARLQKLDDVQLSTLCLLNFPAVYGQFSEGMRRDRKIELLLEHFSYHPAELPVLQQALDEAGSGAARPAETGAGSRAASVQSGGGPVFIGSFTGTYVQGDQTVNNQDRHIEVNAPITNSALNTGDSSTAQVGASPDLSDLLELLDRLQSGLEQIHTQGVAPQETTRAAAEAAGARQEAAAPQPDRRRLADRLANLVSILADSAALLIAAPQLLELARKAMEWAKLLFPG